MYVIEFLGVFKLYDTANGAGNTESMEQNNKTPSDKAEEEIAATRANLDMLSMIQNCFFNVSSIKTNNSSTTLANYRVKIGEEWRKNKENIRSLSYGKTLVVSDSCSDSIRYFLYQDDSIRSIINKCIPFNIIAISNNDATIENDVKLIRKHIRSVVKDEFNFDIEIDSKIKLYIYNNLCDDIVGREYFIDIGIHKIPFWISLKKQLLITLGIILVAAIATIIYNYLKVKYYAQYTAQNQTITIGDKISFLTNIVSGVWGGVIMQVLSLSIDMIIAYIDNDIILKIEPDKAVVSLQQYAQKSSYYKMGKDLEDDIPSIPDLK